MAKDDETMAPGLAPDLPIKLSVTAELSGAAYVPLDQWHRYIPAGGAERLPAPYTVPQGWVACLDLSIYGRTEKGEVDKNVQVITFLNHSTKQKFHGFKGSNTFANFKDDITHDGGKSWLSLTDNFAEMLGKSRALYHDYAEFVGGHSLGGGLAQSEGFRNGISGFVHDSLPISPMVIHRDSTPTHLEEWKNPDAKRFMIHRWGFGEIANLYYFQYRHMFKLCTDGQAVILGEDAGIGSVLNHLPFVSAVRKAVKAHYISPLIDALRRAEELEAREPVAPGQVVGLEASVEVGTDPDAKKDFDNLRKASTHQWFEAPEEPAAWHPERVWSGNIVKSPTTMSLNSEPEQFSTPQSRMSEIQPPEYSEPKQSESPRSESPQPRGRQRLGVEKSQSQSTQSPSHGWQHSM